MAHRERVFVAHDEFSPDSILNQTLKAAARLLVPMTRVSWTQRCLRESLFHLGEVADTAPNDSDLDRLEIGRNAERFRSVFEFARLVLKGASVSPSQGADQSFSLLFPMETVFEEFVGSFILKHAEELGLQRHDVQLQAKGRRKWLLRNDEGNGRFGLRPDIVIDGADGKPQLIIDTKWKRLRGGVEDRHGGVSQADLYQLYAYATRYACPDTMLVFPGVPGVGDKRYAMPNSNQQDLQVRFLDCGCDLWTDRHQITSQLRDMVAKESMNTTSALGS